MSAAIIDPRILIAIAICLIVASWLGEQWSDRSYQRLTRSRRRVRTIHGIRTRRVAR